MTGYRELAKPEIASTGTADSFVRASHFTHSRGAHLVTAVALYTLQQRAYDQFWDRDKDDHPAEAFKDWFHEKENSSTQFLFWATFLNSPSLLKCDHLER